MFIRKKYINRHKILKALQLSYNNNYRPDDFDTSAIELSWTELTGATGLGEEEVLAQIDVLLINDEIFNNEINFNSSYLILQRGTTAYYDEKYLTIGKKEFKENLYDKLKLISGAVLLIIAVLTFAKNFIVTERNSEEIEVLKGEIQDLKSQIHRHVKENKKVKSKM